MRERTKRRLSSDQQRDLMITQADLTALSQHPGWPKLEAEVGRKEERLARVVTTRVLGTNAGLDPIEQAYIRGFVHGMRWFVAVPNQAERTLERFLKEHGITTGEEGNGASS